MKIRNIIIAFALCLGLFACDNRDVDYDVALIYLDHEEGVNFFSQGDVKFQHDEHGHQSGGVCLCEGFGVPFEDGQ